MNRSFLLPLWAALLMPPWAAAHEGEAHGRPVPPMPATPPVAVTAPADGDPAAAALAAGPRFALHSDRLEAVGVLDGRRVWLWLDGWADNRPIAGVPVRVGLGEASVAATAVGDAYRADLPAEPPDGTQPVFVEVRLPATGGAPAAAERLTGRVTVAHDDHDHDDDPASASASAAWRPLAAGGLVAAGGLLAGWWLGRRSRPRHPGGCA
ncbi:hypothetical protein [Aquabacterium sp. J223]|uniref:hypothetical protein n=1 Tax=Aquabacterium sp. J223 TaxID=2898431 RepID=UPI0021AD9CE1|nr:hypothetical protein [Aquabacterium sp. J223]UUX94253.1 hypothetical protein LRS07_13035 [Aquabacterium sp. J223]